MSSLVSKRRRVVAALLAAILLFGTACSAGRQAAQAPVMTTYLMANGLEVDSWDEEYTDDSGCEITVHMQGVTGLRDKKMEQQINQRMADEVEALLNAETPAYRGIHVRLPQGSQLQGQRAYVTINGSFNNILSFSVERSMDFAVPGEEYGQYVGQIRTVNIDLNTGKDITLAELFPEGTDYLSLLNTEAQRQLDAGQALEEEWSWSGYRLAAPFTGLQETQKFTVGPHGLTLYFDEATPEFDVDFYPAVMSVTNTVLWQAGPFVQRFYKGDSSLYDNEMTPELLGWPPEDQQLLAEENDASDERCIIYVRAQAPADLPQPLQEAMKALAVVDETVAERIKAQAQQADSMGYYEIRIDADRYSAFYNIYSYEDAYADGLDVFRRSAQVYDANTAQPAALADLFVPGFDYQAILQEAIAKDYDESAAVLYDRMSWMVQADGLAMWVPVNERETHLITVPYNQFGMDNMTIFH